MCTICVYGASSEMIDQDLLTSAYSVGETIARRGDRLLFGGGKYGVMGAVARGVLENGGTALGVTPEFFRDAGVLMEECELVFTDTMRARKAYLEDFADAFIVCAGGIGTFDEFFETLTLKQLGQHKKPIVIYNRNGCHDSLIAMLEELIRGRFLAQTSRGMYAVAATEAEVFEYIDDRQRRNIYHKDGG